MSDLVHLLWSEKYRPSKIEDLILPSSVKKEFEGYIKDNFIPNITLSGPQGVGKTSIAIAALNILENEWIIINGSKDGNIDTLRTKIQQFASTVSFSGKRKYVLIDEADYLNAQSTQPALRNFIEEFSQNCGFIFTCNYPNRIIKELRSRAPIIDFHFPTAERKTLAQAFFNRACFILDQENIKYEKLVVGQVIKNNFGDWRQIISNLQRYASRGEGIIDAGIFASETNHDFKQLYNFIKTKNFTACRKWVAENSDLDPEHLFRKLFDELPPLLTDSTIPLIILILAEYQFKSSFSSDQEINNIACICEIMAQAAFK